MENSFKYHDQPRESKKPELSQADYNKFKEQQATQQQKLKDFWDPNIYPPFKNDEERDAWVEQKWNEI